MITENDKNIILQCARKFNVSSVILFGSSLDEDGGALCGLLGQRELG